ncbi:pullulanase-type alpha-1,6-glucosidase [Vibrio sonorensis]|uniref:pullulanase-type alpha-1,6-glucosidase n=1 Tax=Vibrio sonorensis TaxID=1004316 RepID=UPI000AE4ED01|nr:pullulanase-type alpha-1,6-glucosidase [Vibrio sonorensis]
MSDENEGANTLYQAGEDEVVLYYKREDNNYQGWGLHLWNGEGCTSTDLESMEISDAGTDWSQPYELSGIHETHGAYYIIKRDLDSPDPHRCINLIIHKGDEKALGSSNQKIELDKLSDSNSLFTFHGNSELYYAPISESPLGITGQQFHWLDANTIVWQKNSLTSDVTLFYSLEANLSLDGALGIENGKEIELSEGAELSAELKMRFPHLADWDVLVVETDEIAQILKSQIIIAAHDASGQLLLASEVQKSGVLDAVYADENTGNAVNQPLGALVEGSQTQFSLWAPTAQNVRLIVYDSSFESTREIDLVENAQSGIWSSEWLDGLVDQYYRYEVTVYHPSTGNIETLLSTDPYSLSLSQNSLYSQVVDLNSPDLKPENWDSHLDNRPALAKDIDHILYEAHLRDLTGEDTLGTNELNGKYVALLESERESMKHLSALKEAGLTTLHLLPVFDIATIDEDREQRVDITDTFERLCQLSSQDEQCSEELKDTSLRDVLMGFEPTLPEAQALMNDIRTLDSFNWGYDPYHYSVPEGSYSTDPMGKVRILEFRKMVKAVHDMGLRLVVDVVYNHTNASGTSVKSVLDKVVPGYYHRLNVKSGEVETSTCCENTATENLMMGKLMIDSLKVWVDAYKVDGFRFDLMAHQPKSLMSQALEEIRSIDPETLFYGEGWDFGEVSGNARFEQASQTNMAGTGIGTFSDRLRDAVRGGSPFDGGVDSQGLHPLRFNQGFGNAAFANEETKLDQSSIEQRLHNQDLVRLGMAGNLASYVLVDHLGMPKLGRDIDYNGAPAGYTSAPSENISYVSKHDNQTLWDNNAYKVATGVSASQRARMQSVSLSTVILGQGIPFIHMGSELLRSKSMQRDSYDSGDWFNRVFFDGSDNNWNVGLPREDKDGTNWPLIQQLLADNTLDPSVADIERTKQQVMDFLTIRSSSELFRLSSAEQVIERVDFHNTGVNQVTGLIAMSIDDGIGTSEDLDPNNDAIFVLINASAVTQTLNVTSAEGFELHSVLQNSTDDITRSSAFDSGSFTVPALTTAVFVRPQGETQGIGLPVDSSVKDFSQIPPYGDTQIYVMGTMNKAPWSADEDWIMTYLGNGRYSTSMMLDVGEYFFKFAEQAWNYPNVGCDGGARFLEESVNLGSEGNCYLEVDQQGFYQFILDAQALQIGQESTPMIGVIAPQ